VEIFDTTTGQEFVGNKPYALVNTSAEAVESRFPNAGGSYDPLTQTSHVTFDVGRVFWADKAREQVKVTRCRAACPPTPTCCWCTSTPPTASAAPPSPSPAPTTTGFTVANGSTVPKPPKS
jgi:hypothetical protein